MKIIKIILGIVVILPIIMVAKNMKTPSNLGITEGMLAPLPKSPNAVSSQTENTDRHVPPFPFKGTLEESKAALLNVLGEYGNIEVISSEGNYIHAINTTSRMKFKDDLEFFFDEQAELIHFRSASRVGYSDRGLNRERYDRLNKLYTE